MNTETETTAAERREIVAGHNRNDSYIPDDVAAQILTRLPIKSVGRFTAVCKSWLGIITARSFYYLRAKNNPHSTFYAVASAHRSTYELHVSHPYRGGESFGGYMFKVSEPTGWYIKPRVLNFFDSITIKNVGSCNGLVCVVGSGEIEILNPITHESVTVEIDDPIIDGEQSDNQQGYNEVHVFGYSPSTDEYKVLKWRRNTNSYSIFTVGADKRWRELPTSLFGGTWRNPKVVLCNGAFHWLVIGENEDKYILAFDIAQESTRRITIPTTQGIGQGSRLLVLDDQLCLFIGPGGIIVWKMEGYREDRCSWSQIMVPLIPTPCSHSYRARLVRPRNEFLEREYFQPIDCGAKHGGIILLRGDRDGHLAMCCPKRKTHTRIVAPTEAGMLFEFTPNLAPINEIIYGGKLSC